MRNRELRMQMFSDILHATHLHFPFLYWWAFKINQRLKTISPFWKITFILQIPQFLDSDLNFWLVLYAYYQKLNNANDEWWVTCKMSQIVK